MDVAVIPTNRPVIRVDEPDAVFPTKRDKEEAVVEEIRAIHATGQPFWWAPRAWRNPSGSARG